MRDEWLFGGESFKISHRFIKYELDLRNDCVADLSLYCELMF